MTLAQLIEAALEEDIPNGDVTSDALGMNPHFGTAYLIAKQDLVVSGSDIFTKVVHQVEGQLACHWKFADGEAVLKGQILCHIQGNLLALLKAERVALNFLGHLSGVATLTRQFVTACAGTKARILDTRKTTPLLRPLEKKAVVDGGGMNHRLNLSEAVLIKENHLAVGEGITATVQLIRRTTDKPITIEVKNFAETEEAVAAGVERIMFDNMTLTEMSRCLAVVPSHIQTEATGNMTLERVPAVAQLGVNFISIGALTHSAPVADISLIFNW